LNIENYGGAKMEFSNTNLGTRWETGSHSNYFLISRLGTGGAEFSIQPNGRVQMGPGGSNVFDLSPTGDLTIAGTLTDASSRDLKENFVETDGSILNAVMELPIYFYNYIKDEDSVKHIGPTAEDFAAVFNVGADDKHISPRDLAGVAVAAVQELHEIIKVKDAEINAMQIELSEQEERIEELEAQNADLETRLAALEAMVLEQMEKND
jgi:hypothetical protein